MLRRESAAEAAASRAAYLARLAARVERRDARPQTWCRELHAAAEEAHGVSARACADIAAAEERQPLVSGGTGVDEDEYEDGVVVEEEEKRLLVGTSEDDEDEDVAEMETDREDRGWQWCCGCTMQ